MSQDTLFQLHALLETASKLAQLYPELGDVWDTIENARSELDQVECRLARRPQK